MFSMGTSVSSSFSWKVMLIVSEMRCFFVVCMMGAVCANVLIDERYDTELPALHLPVDTCEQGVAWRDFRVELQVVNA